MKRKFDGKCSHSGYHGMTIACPRSLRIFHSTGLPKESGQAAVHASHSWASTASLCISVCVFMSLFICHVMYHFVCLFMCLVSLRAVAVLLRQRKNHLQSCSCCLSLSFFFLSFFPGLCYSTTILDKRSLD